MIFPSGMSMYRLAEQYDAWSADFAGDIPFYRRMADRYATRGAILELCCGTGRITLELAAPGRRITGIDITPEMVERAVRKGRDRTADVRFLVGDARSFTLEERFDLIFIPFNSIAHFHTLEDILALFRAAREHLKPAGRFIIDIFPPSLEYLTRPADKFFPTMTYDAPDGSGKVTIEETATYDAVSQIRHIVWHFRMPDGESMRHDLDMRMFFPQELLALVQLGGFTVEARYGNFDESPFTGESPKQLLILRKNP